MTCERNMRETTAGLRSSGFFRFIDPKVFLGENALKGQKLLAQGNALGIIAICEAPCKGKSFVNYLILKAFALTGRQVCVHKHPGRCPGLRASAPSGRAAYMGSMVQSYVLHSSSFRAYWVISTIQFENFSTISSSM